MSFGPPRLYPTHRYLLKNGISRMDRRSVSLGEIDWRDSRFKQVKLALRLALRDQQNGRCIFCRRKIVVERRNALEDIEHYLDKSKPHYKKWTFCPVNLAVACRPCNFVKSTKELGDAAIAASQRYAPSMGVFKWLHPYFDDYHQNIEILNGWVYKVRSTAPRRDAAQAMIQDLELDKLVTMHAYATAIKEKNFRLTVLAQRAFQKGNMVRAGKLLEISKAFQQQSWPDY